MTNIICVKYGDKYTHEDVNRLYKMVAKNFLLPFIFYCVTENPKDLHGDIQVIPIDEDLGLDGYWWKFLIFNPELYKEVDTTIYFDLDTIIQNNFEYFINLKEKNKITIGYTGVVEEEETGGLDLKYLTGVNSSIMVFNPLEVSDIYHSFISDKKYNMEKYFGVCRYLWNREFDRLTYLEYEKDFYSFLKHHEVVNHNFIKRKKFKPGTLSHYNQPVFYDMTATICMLNGANDIGIYDECLDFFSNYYK